VVYEAIRTDSGRAEIYGALKVKMSSLSLKWKGTGRKLRCKQEQ